MGAFLAPLTCGAIGENEGWEFGFLVAGIGMLIGYLVFVWGQRTGAYGEIGLAPDEAPKENIIKSIPNKLLPYMVVIVLVTTATALITYNDVVDIMLAALAILVIGYLLVQAGKMEVVAKQRIWVVVILLLFTTIFWTFFELAGSALNLFTARNVDKSIAGFEIKTTFFQSFNPLFIMVFAPVFSFIWIKLANANKEPAAPYKFGIGLILLGLGFVVLQLGGSAAKAGMVPAMFMVWLYLLHTIGELTLSPVGLSLVTKLSPKHMVAFMMGIWFLSSSIAHQGGKHIAKLTTVNEKIIVESDAFRNADINENIKMLVLKDEFKAELEEGSIEALLTNKDFVAALNSVSPDQQYAVSNITVQSLLDDAESYKGSKKIKMQKAATISILSKAEEALDTKVKDIASLENYVDNSQGVAIANVIKIESLNKGLNVFGLLGWIAAACGLLLILLGRPISIWMHGIK
jgi:POT family proton-dependent oligopeptide transporter